MPSPAPRRILRSLEGVPPHVVDESRGVVAWHTEPWGVVTQLLGPRHADAHLSRFYIHDLHARVLSLRPDPDTRLSIVHDFSDITGYDRAIRQPVTEWCIARRHEIARAALVLPPTGRITRMGIQVGASMVRVVGLEFDTVESLGEGVERFGLRPRRDL